MSGGFEFAVSVGRWVSQCAEITSSSRGRTPTSAGKALSHASSDVHGLPCGQSMKKHGPPPCGMKYVGRVLNGRDTLRTPDQNDARDEEQRSRYPREVDRALRDAKDAALIEDERRQHLAGYDQCEDGGRAAARDQDDDCDDVGGAEESARQQPPRYT